MNIRRKSVYAVLTGILFAGMMTGCQKEETVNLGCSIEQFQTEKAYFIEANRIMGFNSGDNVRLNNSTYQIASDGTSGKLNGVASASSYVAVYPAEYMGGSVNLTNQTQVNMTLPDKQIYQTTTVGGTTYQIVKAPMAGYLSGSGSTLPFYNMGAILKVIVKNDFSTAMNVNYIQLTASKAWLCGAAIAKGLNTNTPYIEMNTTNTDAQKSVMLQMNTPITINGNSQKAFYISIPRVTDRDNRFTIEVSATVTENNVSFIRVYSKTQGASKVGTIARNQAGAALYSLSSSDPYNPPYIELHCGNSVNEKIAFASGNLQYNPGLNKWRFAEHQYDVIGGSWWYGGNTWYGTPKTGNNTREADGRATQNAWMDLFAWGTSGWNNGNTNYSNVIGTTTSIPFYHPASWIVRYAISGNTYQYGDYGCQYGPAGANNLTGSYANSDWGTYNTIWNYDLTQSYPAGTWRTPTKDEWDCLISPDQGKVGFAEIDGQTYVRHNTTTYYKASGIIIVPKGWVDPKPNNKTFKSILEANRAWFPDNTYTKAELDVLIASGAIYLPAGGSREDRWESGYGTCPTVGGYPVDDHNNITGNYWTSTANGTAEAYKMRFENEYANTNVNPSNYSTICRTEGGRRCYGHSVRLIRVVQ